MTQVCDFSDQSVSIPAIKAAGFVGIISYASSYGGKNLSKSNLDEALSLGLEVGAVCEQGAQQAQNPANAPGDAQAANNWLDSIGFGGHALYVVANDPSQVAPVTFPTVEEYFTAYKANSPRVLGAYGERQLILDLMAKGLVVYGWGVETWGGGAGLHLEQMVNNVDTHGLSIDVDTVLQDDWGQYPNPNPPPTGGDMQTPKISFKAGQLDVFQVNNGFIWHKWNVGGNWYNECLGGPFGGNASGTQNTKATFTGTPQVSFEYGVAVELTVEDSTGYVWYFVQQATSGAWGYNKLP